MIIKKLELHNFGVYAGDNRFLFEGNKPIVLVGGMNGRGKTTFLEAVLLALYGSNSVAYSESEYRSYLQYLRSFVNRNAEDKECSVELEFEIDNGTKENYVVKRKWDILTKKTKEEIFVYKDGKFNEFLTNNWPMFVENILPSALSSFFFFDGEKIAEMAVDSTNVQLKNAIRSMLGINVLDVLENDILRNLKKVSKKGTDSNKTSEELEALRSKKDYAAIELEEITTNQYQYLMKQLSQKGYRTCEPYDKETKQMQPRYLKEAMKMIIEEDKITGTEFLEVVSENGTSISEEIVENILNLDEGYLRMNDSSGEVVTLARR